MNPRSEQALVGLFVLVATAVLVGTVFAISGAFGRSTHTYHSFVTFAGGIESGSGVRYSGGPKIGRVDRVLIDPQNPARIEITSKSFPVPRKLPSLPMVLSSPLKTTSTSTLSPLRLMISALMPPS